MIKELSSIIGEAKDISEMLVKIQDKHMYFRHIMYQNYGNYVRCTLPSIMDGSTSITIRPVDKYYAERVSMYKYYKGISPSIVYSKTRNEMTLSIRKVGSTHNLDDIHLTDEWYFQNSLLYDDVSLRGLVLVKALYSTKECPSFNGTIAELRKFVKVVKSVDNG